MAEQEGEPRGGLPSVVNITEAPTVLKSGTWLGNLYPVTIVSDEKGATEAEVRLGPEARQTVVDNLPEELTLEQFRRVIDLLDTYGDVFSENKFDMGRTKLVVHTIDTGGNRPICQSLRRHPHAHLDIIDEQVTELKKGKGRCLL